MREGCVPVCAWFFQIRLTKFSFEVRFCDSCVLHFLFLMFYLFPPNSLCLCHCACFNTASSRGPHGKKPTVKRVAKTHSA